MSQQGASPQARFVAIFDRLPVYARAIEEAWPEQAATVSATCIAGWRMALDELRACHAELILASEVRLLDTFHEAIGWAESVCPDGLREAEAANQTGFDCLLHLDRLKAEVEMAEGVAQDAPPPRSPADPSRREAPPGPDGDEAAATVALWSSDPSQVFERLRDRVCEALQLVVEIHRLARAAARRESLADVGKELQDPLWQATAKAQAIWFGTPISRYLDRTEGPVYLDRAESGTLPRVSGSCYHDLALGVAAGLLRWSEESIPARDYVASMRFYTGAGDDVSHCLSELTSSVRCESQQGLARWKAEAVAPSRSPLFAPETLDSSQCPGCKSRVPEEFGTLPIVPCLTSRRWELHTGLVVMPTTGPEGTPPAVVRLTSPYWRPILPEPGRDREGPKGGRSGEEDHEGGRNQQVGSSKRRKPGRPADTNADADKRVYEAWQSSQYRKYEDLGRELRLKKREVAGAIDRHRKRLEREGK